LGFGLGKRLVVFWGIEVDGLEVENLVLVARGGCGAAVALI